MKKRRTTLEKEIEKAVERSSEIEDMSFQRAKKNRKMIRLLRRYGRAFSIPRE